MRNKLILFTLITALGVTAASKVSAQEPDLSFGTNGRVYTSFGSFSSFCHGMILLPDEKIVSVGNNTNTTLAILISRHNADGTPDNSFNSTGTKRIDFGSAYEFCYSVLAQSDNKLVLAGSSNGNAALARLLPDGDFDDSFSDDGKVTLSFGVGNGSAFQKIILQPDGKIIAIGEAYNTSSFDFAVARFDSNGSVDASFGTDGKTTVNFNNFNDFGRNAVLQSDGKIVIVGAAKNSNGNSSIALLRLNADGSPDNTFGTAGKTTATISGLADDYAESVAIVENDKIVIGGYTAGNFLLMRYNTNGTPDNSFGSNGYTITDFDDFQDKAYSLLVDNTGSIYLSGHGYETGNGGLFHFAVAKYNSNGFPDNTFDSDGKMTIVMGADGSTIFDMAIQPDGKLLFGGQSTNIAGGLTDFALLRLANSTTGIADIPWVKDEVVLYPNPASDYIVLLNSASLGKGLIKIYDTQGHLVLQTSTGGSSCKTDISALPAGLYHLSHSNQQATRSFTFIKK